jgi:transcriptional regulator GlxA family with amidase domain
MQAELILQERFPKKISVTGIARKIGVSPSSLQAHFVHLRGHSPLEHLHEIRARHAVAMIQNTNDPLETVAVRCGYHSASHLGMHIKRATGKTPSHLRRLKTDETSINK